MALYSIQRNCLNRYLMWKKFGRPLSSNSNEPIEGVALSFTKYNDRKSDLDPIVIMHGLFGNKTNWNSIAKALNKQCQREVYCIDARNHGLSPHSPNMTYHHMAKDLEKFIAEQGIASAVVVGHSMGGRAAMCLSFTKPTLVSRLCVIDISPLYTSPSLVTMQVYLKTLRDIDFPKHLPLSECRKLVDQLLTPNIPDPRIRSFLITNLDTSKSGNAWRVNLPVIDDSFQTEIAAFPKFPSGTRFEKPTLFIAGLESDYVKPETIKDISKLFPRANYLYVSKAGHWVHADKPSVVIGSIDFLLKTLC